MFEIGTIRAQLNELAFRDGKREISLGLISDLFPDKPATEVEIELTRLEERLRKHDLLLERGAEKPDELYAAQTLKYRAIDLAWLANGMQWVAKITTVALEMVVPAAIGMWLDRELGTRFLALLGIILGVPLGVWHLLKITKRTRNRGH